MPSPDGAAPALEIHDVHKTFGSRRVLQGVDLTVPPGSITAIVGPSGEGKTTLLRIIVGFDHCDRGSVSLRGRVVEGAGRPVPPEHRHLGIVPQEGALFPHLDVGANVGFGLSRGAEREGRVRECLRLVGLDGRERARPAELSGGQQQRVALARALAPRPWLVMLDEPFSSLDAGLRVQLRAEVCAALRAEHATALLVTHDQHEALSTADQVAVLLAGRIAQVGDPLEVYRSPVSLEVATFLGEAVLVSAWASGDRARSPLGGLQLQSTDVGSGELTAVVRPEQLRLDGGADAPTARIVATTFFGAEVVVDLAVEGVDGPCRARVAAHEAPTTGSTVHVRVEGAVPSFVTARTSRPSAQVTP